MPLEEMNSFFDARVKDYEEYVRQEADGAQDYYRETAKLIPKRKRLSLVDLGVGTGLELDEIFQQNPGVTVTGIDIGGDASEASGEEPEANGAGPSGKGKLLRI